MNILLDQVLHIYRGVVAAVPQMVLSLLILLLTSLIARLARHLVGRVLQKSRVRQSLKNLFVLLASIGVWTLGIMMAALVAFPNLTPTKLLAGLGIGSVAIGFAFKDIFENFLAGILILLRRELRIGDTMECGDIFGDVENILIRETHVRCPDDQLIIVPNSFLFKNPLWILTDKDQRRTSIICGVAYSEDIDAARTVIAQAVQSCDTVKTDRHPVQVFAKEFADSSINFEVTWWTGSTPGDIRCSRDEVVAAVKRSLDQAGIEIPFPYRTLTFKEPVSHISKPPGEESASGEA